MRVLIVEDEPQIAQSIKKALEASGFVAEISEDGESAWFLGGTEAYSAIVLDIGLPRLDGISVLRNWRSEGVAIPVLILTARGSWPERVDGINAGADDYLVKPFQMEELVARLRALIRRSVGQANPLLEVGDLVIDLRQMRVSESGSLVNLTPLEFRLLSFLAHNRGRVVSQEEIASNIYFQDHEPGSNAVEVTVGRIRKKISTNIIETKRGFGYAFVHGSS
jgi:two-component system, OmpR family, response regulator